MSGSKKVRALPPFRATVLPAAPDDVLEADELCTFVCRRVDKAWLWAVECRRTRHIVAYAIGDRSEQTCRHLWHKLPESYRGCQSFSDFWRAYAAVFPVDTHQCVGKETGVTAHIERWNNTLRQRNARYVRKTLSFSKSWRWHHLVTKWLIVSYNHDVSLTI